MSAFDLPPVALPSAQKPDARTVVDAGQSVMRQVICLADAFDPANVLPVTTKSPLSDGIAIPVRMSPEKYTDVSFSGTGAGLVAPELTVIGVGTAPGMTISQANGNLVILTGTTANAEFVARGLTSFNGALTLKEVTTLSQRIVNNNFYIELVDIIGDTLPYNIINATTVDVTKVAHGFTVANIGQRMDMCAVTSVGIPQEVVIASIPDANTIRFTTVTNPATGSGTCSLTGWNKIELWYTGAVATNVALNTRRRGWQNTATAFTAATTATGHMISLNSENGIVSISDKGIAGLAQVLSNRGSYDFNVPAQNTELYLQIRAKNGTVAPASTTTWTLAMVRIEDYIAQQVSLTNIRQQTYQSPVPVTIFSSGTLTVVATGGAAHGTAISGNPVRTAMRATSAAVAVATGQVCDQISTLYGAQITKPFSIPELEWTFSGAVITSTGDVALASAAGAGIRRYLTAIQIDNGDMAARVIEIKDGSTVIWRGLVAANNSRMIQFPTPLRTTANAVLNVAATTTPTLLYINAQGYTAP